MALSPAIGVYFLWRCLRDRRYWAGLSQRLGWLPAHYRRTAHGAVWFHAVSVGEVLSAVPLIKALRDVEPNAAIYVSTTTLAGHAMAEERLAGTKLADGVFFAPLDFRFAVRAVLRAIKPSLVVVMETEIWPNLYRESRRSGASLAVVNGRISDKAMPRYRHWRWFFAPVLEWPNRIHVQSRQDFERYAELGAPLERLALSGNLKFDFEPSSKPVAPEIADLLARTAPDKIWIAASTMPPASAGDADEDDVVIEAFRKLVKRHSKLLLILVPRRPERFDSAAEKLAAAGIPHVRRSKLQGSAGGPLELPGVLLLDSMGELAALFALADAVFMGGSLAQRGGHNLIEPAFFGKPVITGPNNQNFRAIHEEFQAAGGVVDIAGPSDLAPAVDGLLEDPSASHQIGRAGQRVSESKRGVARRIATDLAFWRSLAVPYDMQSIWSRMLLTPLAAIWASGARTGKNARELEAPVISIGGITMGGAGKTPFAIWLCEKLNELEVRPAILTRGYKRRSPHAQVLVAKGMAAEVDITGDEAQIFVRRRCADIGIDADRFAAGQSLQRVSRPDVFLLDDGFQHRALARNCDIVLIDSLDPFGGGSVFPLGRMREPLEKLKLASIFILTRVDPGRPVEGIRRELARVNPQAPVFESSVVVKGWKGAIPKGKAAAFCGLGNPATFWETLAKLGVEVEFRWSFDDHHRYNRRELRRLRYWARKLSLNYLVTTEKDVMNLPAGAEQILKPLELCWLEITVEVREAKELTQTLLRQIGKGEEIGLKSENPSQTGKG